jgi:hypothetical protein
LLSWCHRDFLLAACQDSPIALDTEGCLVTFQGCKEWEFMPIHQQSVVKAVTSPVHNCFPHKLIARVSLQRPAITSMTLVTPLATTTDMQRSVAIEMSTELRAQAPIEAQPIGNGKLRMLKKGCYALITLARFTDDNLDPTLIRQELRNELPEWPLSSFAGHHLAPKDFWNLEMSPEEARLEFYKLKAQGKENLYVRIPADSKQ